MIILKTNEEIEKMYAAGQAVAEILQILAEKAKPGITTANLDAIAEHECHRRGALPVFKNYPNPRGGRPFPGCICASVNEEVVHGIPSSRVLKDGDILSIDFGLILNGYAGDSALTVPIGDVGPEAKKLIQVTEEALMKGIEEARPGNLLGMVSNAVQKHAEQNGFSVVRDFVGHGIGKSMHEDPPVPNYGRKDQGPVLKEGMTIAIEPMLNAGTHRVITGNDEWTVITRDRKLSAHFEHSIAILADGPKILTLRQ